MSFSCNETHFKSFCATLTEVMSILNTNTNTEYKTTQRQIRRNVKHSEEKAVLTGALCSADL